MANLSANANDSTHRQSWLALAALVFAHVAFNVLFNPTGPTDLRNDWPYLAATGAVFVQPLIFATWLSLGPPPAVKRIPVTIAAMMVVFLAASIRRWSIFSDRYTSNFLDLEWFVLNSAFFLVGTILGFAARTLFGWRIVNTRTVSADLTDNRFSVKYLLALTTICAVLLGVGCNLAMQMSITLLAEILIPIGIFLVMLPVLTVPISVLCNRPSALVLLVLAAVWVALTWLGVHIIFTTVFRRALTSESEAARQAFLLQLGGAIGGGLSAVIVRLSGYRLLSSAATVPWLQPASS